VKINADEEEGYTVKAEVLVPTARFTVTGMGAAELPSTPMVKVACWEKMLPRPLVFTPTVKVAAVFAGTDAMTSGLT
jgi:hypothetical protein